MLLELNKIYQGDCLELMKELPDKSIDLVMTDPPYNVGLDYTSTDDNKSDYKKWCDEWFNECMRISNIVVFTPGMVNLNFWYKYEPYHTMCWFKPNQCSPSRLRGFNIWEPILLFGKPKKRVSQDAFYVPISIQPDTGSHPCPKSIQAWIYFIKELSDEGDLIIDPFIGSGTTAIACIRTNRNFIGMEISPEYCAIVNKRIALEKCEPYVETKDDKELRLF